MLAAALMRGQMDVAFLRREHPTTGLAFKSLIRESPVVLVPTNHRLARRRAISPQELEREIHIDPSRLAPVLRGVIDDYAKKIGIEMKPEYDAENLSAAMSLVASTGGVTLFPRYVQNMLTRSVVARPLLGEIPMIELVMSYNKSNTSPVLKKLLARADELIDRVSG